MSSDDLSDSSVIEWVRHVSGEKLSIELLPDREIAVDTEQSPRSLEKESSKTIGNAGTAHSMSAADIERDK